MYSIKTNGKDTQHRQPETGHCDPPPGMTHQGEQGDSPQNYQCGYSVVILCGSAFLASIMLLSSVNSH